MNYAQTPSLSENIKSEIPYLDKIDVIRFVAAMMVVIYHAYADWINNWHYLKFMTNSADQQNLNALGRPINTFLMNGGYGVDIFFLISGFLITYLLLKEKQASNGKIDVLKFYVRRSLRIWPLYFLIIVLSPFIIKWVGQTYNPNYIANIFFYNNFDTMQHHSWIFPLAHFWSLCIEEHFYVFWPLIICFVPNKQLMRTFMVLILISIIYRGYLITNVKEPWYPLFLSTFSRFDVLVIGAIAAYIHFMNPIKLTVSKTTRLVVYSAFMMAICYDNITSWDTFFAACFKKYFYISIVLFALLNFLFNEKPLFEFMNNKLFKYFGKIS
ncbi:MAG TPA: acyltransferase, partial [Bacteroidia bacterium]|nr:acyltransferase [Bacteroidia bacterium]